MARIQTEPFVRKNWLIIGSNAAMFVYGVVLALLGSILPLMGERIHLDLAQAGNLFLGMNFAMLVSMVGLGVLMDWMGKKPILIAGSLVVALSLLLINRASSYTAVLVGVVLLGIGGGALNGAANTLVADLERDPRGKASALNLLGVYFGFGALSLPFIMGAGIKGLGLAPILYLALVLALVPNFVFIGLTFPPLPTRRTSLWAESVQLVRNPVVLLLGSLLFFESGNEFIVGGYASTYFKSNMGSSISVASYILSGYWAAMMAGRVISSRLLLRMNSLTLVKVSALGSAIAGLVLLLATSTLAAIAGVVLLGLSFASIFPTSLGMASSRFEAYSGTVFGILFGIALSGGMTLPWAVGQFSARHGLHAGLGVVIVNALLILILQHFIQPPKNGIPKM
ncbi:MAG: MFS transporter [Acidobacteriia bacterium]|nr:MFS transporter [Terriglobia bacterium]